MREPAVFEKILITVGTTDFDSLVELLDASATRLATSLCALGCSILRVQIGRGRKEPLDLARECVARGINFTCFRFAPSMEPEIMGATLVLSHAGAGSVIETLSAPNRPYLIVVVNDSLMGNHQTELADAMAESGYCMSVNPVGLVALLLSSPGARACLPPLRPYPAARPEALAAAVAETVLESER